MALRNIIIEGDPALTKRCRPVTDFNKRLHVLLDDMRETLTSAEGVGLAAPQVGILRRAVLVLDTEVPEGEEEVLMELINPEVVFAEGEQGGPEGCLSVPGVFGYVYRPEHIKVRAQDRDGNHFEADVRGLTARTVCHEVAHLEGQLFTKVADHIMSDEELDEWYGQENVRENSEKARARKKRDSRKKKR